MDSVQFLSPDFVFRFKQFSVKAAKKDEKNTRKAVHFLIKYLIEVKDIFKL